MLLYVCQKDCGENCMDKSITKTWQLPFDILTFQTQFVEQIIIEKFVLVRHSKILNKAASCTHQPIFLLCQLERSSRLNAKLCSSPETLQRRGVEFYGVPQPQKCCEYTNECTVGQKCIRGNKDLFAVDDPKNSHFILQALFDGCFSPDIERSDKTMWYHPHIVFHVRKLLRENQFFSVRTFAIIINNTLVLVSLLRLGVTV